MTERVAAAIKARWQQRDGKVTWNDVAQAAIAAMREPTEDGLDAFARAFGWQPLTTAGRENARHAWHAMIDAAKD